MQPDLNSSTIIPDVGFVQIELRMTSTGYINFYIKEDYPKFSDNTVQYWHLPSESDKIAVSIWLFTESENALRLKLQYDYT